MYLLNAASCFSFTLLQDSYCVAYLWNRHNRSCQMMPRLLHSSELVNGECDYFVDDRCNTTSPACPSDFTICLRSLRDRRFHISLKNQGWDAHSASCKSRSSELAEFPGNLEAAMRDYFPMFRSMLLQGMFNVRKCNKFGPTNIQCQPFIGAKRRAGIYYWVRNGSPMETTYNLPQVIPVFKRNLKDAICFNVGTSASLVKFRYDLKDQGPTFWQLGLCECFL